MKKYFSNVLVGYSGAGVVPYFVDDLVTCGIVCLIVAIALMYLNDFIVKNYWQYDYHPKRKI